MKIYVGCRVGGGGAGRKHVLEIFGDVSVDKTAFSVFLIFIYVGLLWAGQGMVRFLWGGGGGAGGNFFFPAMILSLVLLQVFIGLLRSWKKSEASAVVSPVAIIRSFLSG